MDFYSGGLHIGGIFASEILGAYFCEGIIGILRYMAELVHGEKEYSDWLPER